MEIKKLVPTTKFIIDYLGDEDLHELTPSQSLSRLMTINQFIYFVSKMLDVSMFVPFQRFTGSALAESCEGTPSSIGTILGPGHEEYELAKENVLFPGFQYKDSSHDPNMGYITDENELVNPYWLDKVSGIWRPAQGLRLVEDLADFGLDINSEIIFGDE